MITQPTGLALEDWVSQVTLDLGLPGRMYGSDWQAWGAQQLIDSTLPSGIPSPYQFSDWRGWAERLCGIL